MSYRRKLTPNEVEFLNGQVCTFVCGVTGCTWRMTTRLDTWLRVREAHRQEAHPSFKPPRRKGKTAPRSFIVREMQEIAA